MKKRILLVDDEPSFTRIVRRHLEGTGKYEIRVENDSMKVLAAAREFQPDLVVLDVIMPDMDGGEIAAIMRADARLKRVPLVFLTAIVSKEHVQRQGDVIGGQTYLAKPLDMPDLIRHIEEKLDQAA
jgi:CheY-like chemotaxis protein